MNFKSINLPVLVKDLIFLGLMIIAIVVGVKTEQPLYGVGVFLVVTILAIVFRL